ncbi:MAG: hypothetical protein ACLUKN_16960 [Bacilli bacterium]
MAVVQVLKNEMLGEVVLHWGFLSASSLRTHLRELSRLRLAKIVAERGRLMQEARDASEGAMASFIGGSVEAVAEYCKEFDVDMSNLNCPGQVVISGEAKKIAAAVAAAKSAKRLRWWCR